MPDVTRSEHLINFIPSWPGLQPTLGRLHKFACPAIHVLGCKEKRGCPARGRAWRWHQCPAPLAAYIW